MEGMPPEAEIQGSVVDPNTLVVIGGMVLKESRRSASNGACVAVAQLDDGTIVVGDTKKPWQKVLRFTPVEWEAFILGVKDGEFDLQNVYQTSDRGLKFAALRRAWSWLRRPKLFGV